MFTGSHVDVSDPPFKINKQYEMKLLVEEINITKLEKNVYLKT